MVYYPNNLKVTIPQFCMTLHIWIKKDKFNSIKMKSRYYILSLLLSVVMTTGFSSDKTREEQKDEKKLDKRSQVEMMINSRDFVFIPRLALPSGMKPVNLATNQYGVKFQPYFIYSFKAIFWPGLRAVGYGTILD